MSQGKEFITITLSDPVKCTEKYGSFISYRISTSTNKNIFASRDFVVNRRFSDFVWLIKELSRSYPGAIIPALPEKQTVGRFTSDFVEARQRALEKFLQRVAVHPDLGNAAGFVTFLQGDDLALAKSMEEMKAAKPKLTSTAMSWFEGTVNTIQNSGKAEIEKSAADLQVDDMIVYITAFEKQMQNVTQHTESWIKKYKENSIALAELGQSFTWLGQSEAAGLGETLTQLGKVTESVATTGTAHSEAQAIQTEESFKEYQRIIASVRQAIHQRQEKRQAYVDALTDVEVKQSAYNKLVGVAGKEEQANQKQQLATKAQAAADAAKHEYEKVSERLLSEFEKFKYQKASDFQNILTTFIELQIEHQRKTLEAWESLVPDLRATTITTVPGGGAYTGYRGVEDEAPPYPPSSFMSNNYSDQIPHPQEYTSFNPHDEDDFVGV